MNLHETKYGQRFFDHQLPALTNALVKIAAALSKKPQTVHLSPHDSPDYLKDLFHGRLEPDAEPSPSPPQDRAADAAYARLRENTPQDLMHLIETYRLTAEERNDLYLDQAFAIGYRTAIHLIAAGLFTLAGTKEGV